jgi:hypothetical protein
MTITYNINYTLDIDLISPDTQKNRTVELLINTNLISTCNLTWNNTYKGTMMTNITGTTGRIHYTKVTTTRDGTYTAKFDCITPYSGIPATKTYNIIIDTSTPPENCTELTQQNILVCDKNTPTVSITTTLTPFGDMVKANVTCTDDTGCKPTFNYSLTTRTDCSQETYKNTSSYNNILIFTKNGMLCVKATDNANKYGYANKTINITADTSNPLNITPNVTANITSNVTANTNITSNNYSILHIA